MKVGDIYEGLYCPECGGRVISDGFQSFDNLTIMCHCEDCDWEGTEDECVDEDGDDDADNECGLYGDDAELPAGVKDEVESYVSEKGTSIETWITPRRFVDKHGCDGYIFNSSEEAIDSLLNGADHQNAVDYLDGAQTDEEWISYLVNGGVESQKAETIIRNHDWDEVVRIIVEKCGPERFLSTYSGEVETLSDGSLLYF